MTVEVKDLMALTLKELNAELNRLRKKQRSLVKVGKPDYKLTQEIDKLSRKTRYYSQTKAEPVRFENGLVVNAKQVKAYLKKLPKHAVVEVDLTDDMLTINWNVVGAGKGRLILKNLAHHYPGFVLPSIEEVFESEKETLAQ